MSPLIVRARWETHGCLWVAMLVARMVPGGSLERKVRPLLVAVLVSGADASGLAGGLSVGGGALLAVSAFRGGAVFRVSRDRLEIRVCV